MCYEDLDRQELIVKLEEKDEKIELLDKELDKCKNINLYKEQFINQTELEKIIEKTPLGFCITDQDGYFELVNPAYCNIYGYQQEELLGEHFSIVATEDNKEELISVYNSFVAGNSELRGEWEVKDKQGNHKIVLADAARIKGAAENYKKVTFVIDITKRKELEEKLKQANQKLQEKASTDSLTGLYNHKEIMRKLNLELERAARYDLSLSVMMLDIDDFKEVNDTYGHQTGDNILKSLSTMIEKIIRQEDIIGRYGGEEFLVVFSHTDLDNALEVAQRIRREIAAEKIAGVKITISGGLATLSDDSAQELIKKADNALYQAKGSGKNKIVTY